MFNPPSTSDRNTAIAPRHIEERVRTALADTRVVALVGPRQSGKTTLARQIGGEGRPYFTLDDENVRAAAIADPAGFIGGLKTAAIDEIQRAPPLLLAIKQAVDSDTRPGRFLITGSADLFSGTIAPDSLAGRVETIELLPLSQSEIARQAPSKLLKDCFAGTFEVGPAPRVENLVSRILAGGFPEALTRATPQRRRAWFLNYAGSLAARDVLDIAEVAKADMMRGLIDHAALMTGQLLNLTDLGNRVGVDAKTIDRWLTLLEQIFLIERVRPWYRNEEKRLVKTPKIQMIDPGLLAALRGIDEASLDRDRILIGPLLESFVYGELRKAASLLEDIPRISHYRDKDKVEVDFVLEQGHRRVVGIEVKASATAKTEDFRGLQRLRDATGDAFKTGLVLYSGNSI
jgi:uncharacterized protein